LFACAGLLAEGGPDADAETPAAASGQWAPEDLWLHAHSRSPRTSSGYGGTYHGRGVREPLPARTGSRWPDTTVALDVPDLDEATARDRPFTEVLEARRSRRVHDDAAPITKAQLGELLYRAARLRRCFDGTDGEEVADRPYPSGGATHELEIYPLVTNCAGLAPGLYHYRSDAQTLELVTEPDAATAGLVSRARASAVMTGDPQVVLLVSARFGRVMFKYETIAYSLVLKHVGVLYQTLYLVGEAMGLAVCGLGGGDAEVFATATGLDYFTEGTVGELVLGSASDAEVSWQGERSSP
jgi:SagB-type dehydrogenase family enzyme